MGVLLSLLASLLPATRVEAQSPTLNLSPDSGDPPAVRGTLSGDGWCTPARVTVSGSGVTGSGDVGRAGDLSGDFSVTGSAGDVVTIEVAADCGVTTSNASASFTFNAPPPPSTRTPTPAPALTRTLSPTRPPSVTPTLLTISSVTPTTTPTAAVAPGAPTQGTVTILGCEPAAADISILFTAIGLVGVSPGPPDVEIQPGPPEVEPGPPDFVAPAFASSDPHLFLFDGPSAPLGTLFSVDLEIDAPDCPSDWDPPSGTWFSGDPVNLVVVPPGTSQLFLSNLGNKAPTKKAAEFGEIGAWVTYHEVAGSAAGYSQVFGWNTDLAYATGGELQASVLPFPSDPASSQTTPSGVVKVWDVNCVNCNFTVDLSPLYPQQLLNQGSGIQNFLAKVSLAIKQGWNAAQQFAQSLINSLPGGGGGPAAAQAQPSLPGESSSDYMTAGQGAPLMITEYYFRVVPKTGGQVVGAATNTVRIKFFADGALLDIPIPECAFNPNAADCPPPVPPGPKPYIVEIVSYHGLIPASPGHVDCYIATKETEIIYQKYIWSTDSYVPDPHTYAKGEKFCPEKEEKPEWYEAIVRFVVDGVNLISQAYAALKSAVVDTVVALMPSGLTDVCGKKCLGTILDGVLATMGVPPSIPNFDQLMDQGLDYVAEQAVQQLPVPPGVSGLGPAAVAVWQDQAEAAFKDGMQDGIEAAKLALSESIGHVPDGVPVVPDPLSSLQPATIVLRITRDPNVPEAPGTCSMSAAAADANVVIRSTVFQSAVTPDMQAFNDFHNGPKPGQGPDLAAGAANPYDLYEWGAIPLPSLAPNESMTVPVILIPALTWGTGYGNIDPGAQAVAWSAVYLGGQASIAIPDTPCATGDGLGVQADGSWEAPALPGD